MSEISEEVKKKLFEANPLLCCRMSDVMTYLGVAFILIGVISNAINRSLLLGSTNWFLLALIVFILGIFAWIRGYFSAKEK